MKCQTTYEYPLAQRQKTKALFFFNHTATPEIYTLSLHDALPICRQLLGVDRPGFEEGAGFPARSLQRHLQQMAWRHLVERDTGQCPVRPFADVLEVHEVDARRRSEEHTSELQSRRDLVCRLLLEK